MAPRRPSPAQVRDRRARIAAVALGGVFLLIAVIQGPKLLKMLHGSSSSAIPAPAASSAPAPGKPVSFSSGASSPSLGVGGGQLQGFSLLAPKDPFHSQLPAAPTAGSAAAAAPPKKPATKKPATKPKTPATKTTPTPATATAPPGQQPSTGSVTFVTPAPTGRPVAIVKMNGRKQIVPKGGMFPLAEPLFRVVALGPRRVQIGLVTGSFADGSRVLKLRRGHKLTLVDTTNGSRYVILFVQSTRAELNLTAPSGTVPGTVTTPAAAASAG
jgi:hypothetical protein